MKEREQVNLDRDDSVKCRIIQSAPQVFSDSYTTDVLDPVVYKNPIDNTVISFDQFINKQGEINV